MVYGHSYSYFHTNFPSASSRQSTRSRPRIEPRWNGSEGLLASAARRRSVTYTRPLATAGPESPGPMLVRQQTGGPFVGNFSTMPDSRHTESRLGPSHWGQSSAT